MQLKTLLFLFEKEIHYLNKKEIKEELEFLLSYDNKDGELMHTKHFFTLIHKNKKIYGIFPSLTSTEKYKHLSLKEQINKVIYAELKLKSLASAYHQSLSYYRKMIEDAFESYLKQPVSYRFFEKEKLLIYLNNENTYNYLTVIPYLKLHYQSVECKHSDVIYAFTTRVYCKNCELTGRMVDGIIFWD